MSGAEAGLVLAVISTVIAVIDATKKVYDGASSATGLPEVFREVGGRLPLVRAILGSAKQHIDDGQVDEASCTAMKPVINACEEKAKKLKVIFQKVLPHDDASRIDRYISAAKTFGKGGRVEVLMKGMLDDVLLLASNHGLESATAHQVDQLTKAIQEMSGIKPSIPDSEFQETTFTNNSFGDGHMTNNNVQGNQKFMANYGTGKQFQAETQTFNMGKDY